MLTTHGCKLLGCDGTAFSLWHPIQRTFESVVSSRRDGSVVQLSLPQCPEEQLVPGYVERLQRVGYVSLEPSELRRGLPGSDAYHALSVAVQRDGRLIGALTFYARDAACLSQGRRLALGFASQAAIALTNAELVRRLTEASRVKTEFVSTISHELRTPLNVILGFTEIAMDCAKELPELQEYLRKITDASTDLFDLIETTLAIGRLEAGRDEPRFETVALDTLWSEMHDVCSRMPRTPEVTLDWRDCEPGHVLVTDPRKLSVIVRNLVGNALKFTPRGSVTVSAAGVGDNGIRLAVTDTGVGIRAENQREIFEMFRQGDSSDSRRFGGTGLGLYIVRQYTAQLGGTVTLASAPGRGSEFTIELPLDGRLGARRAA